MDAGIIVILVIVGLMLAVGVLFWRRRSAAPDKDTIGTETVTGRVPLEVTQLKDELPPMDEPVQDLHIPPDALAVLEIEDGPDAIVNGRNVGKRIELHDRRVIIGRNPRQVNIQLYNIDENSSVSRVHCTLEFHEALRCFFITDQGSASGTRVEGRPIPAHKAHSLRDGDLIELGMMSSQGAMLRFRTTFNPPERINVEMIAEPKDTIRQQMLEIAGVRTAAIPINVFISYNHNDRAHMHVIRDGLIAAGLTTWTDENLEPGTPNWRKEVQAAIENAGCVVVILSPEAKDSAWVGEELDYARVHKRRIFTVLIRGDESNAIPFGLTGVQWVDLRDYEEGLSDAVRHTALAQLVAVVKGHLEK
jgi:pSer/pThr/pTyr-binding forkhead associated (FHA) protein